MRNPSNGNAFNGRYFHSASLHAESGLYIFGGTADNKKLNDVIRYDTIRNKFSKLKPVDPEKKPCERDF